jgi:hypothetical protein
MLGGDSSGPRYVLHHGLHHTLCRSNKGALGVDGQDFADIEAHGLQRWLGELALVDRTPLECLSGT